MSNLIQVADRRDYVISVVTSPIPALSGPQQISVSLDTDFPWMWTGFFVGSIYSLTPILGGVVAVAPGDLTFQLLDSNRNYYFSDFVRADTIQYAVTSSNVAGGNIRNEIFPVNPEQLQPAGGSFVLYANNNNAAGNLVFELVLTGYKIKDDCLKTKPPTRGSAAANLRGGR
jgi:hypothetical protein